MDMWQDIVDGNDEWTTRAFFPGQPFRKNEFDRGGEPKAVCTPSIRGPASTFGVSLVINAGVASLVLLFLVH